MSGCFSFLWSCFRGKTAQPDRQGIEFEQGTNPTFTVTDEICFRGMGAPYQDGKDHETKGTPRVFQNGGTTNMVSTSRSLEQAFNFGRAVSRGDNMYMYAVVTHAGMGVDCQASADKNVVTPEREIALKTLPFSDLIGYRKADKNMTFTAPPVYLGTWAAKIADLRDDPGFATLQVWQSGVSCKGH